MGLAPGIVLFHFKMFTHVAASGLSYGMWAVRCGVCVFLSSCGAEAQ